MANIFTTLESPYWKNVVFPEFAKKYPADAKKILLEQQGNKRPPAGSNFAKGVISEIRQALDPNFENDWGLWSRPTVMLHNARGGVEYQEEQVKYFGSALLDVNSPNSWTDYKIRASRAGLETRMWHHCHTYSDVASLCNLTKLAGQKECGVNLENIVDAGITPQGVADIIDTILGKDSICIIPNLGWIQNLDWSPLSRHVFLLEIFLNDPWKDWKLLSDKQVIEQCAYHARECGAKKVSILCGIYDASSYNPDARKVTPQEYLTAIKEAGETFGGVYLGDNNGPDYSGWA